MDLEIYNHAKNYRDSYIKKNPNRSVEDAIIVAKNYAIGEYRFIDPEGPGEEWINNLEKALRE